MPDAVHAVPVRSGDAARPLERRTGTLPRLLAAASTVAVLAALAACSNGGPGPSRSTPGDVTVGPSVGVQKQAAPTAAVPARWPLTGVAGTVANRPALAVKIENSREARPQTGLDQADMVWEEVVEGGITRFAAVFDSQVPAEVGPVRSVRPMDSTILAPMHGLIAFSGGQPGFVQLLSDAGLQIFSQDQGAPGFARKSGVAPAPHNVYGTPSTWWSNADAQHQAPPAPQFVVARQASAASAVVAGAPAGAVNITMSGYSQPSWTWDGGSGTWLRSEGGTPAVVRSGARLAATNVVVLRVTLVDTGTKDPAGNPVPETVLTGSGEALVATGGKTVKATWTKGAKPEVLKLTGTDGQPVSLAPGNTWVEMVPTNGSVTAG
ncbi:DUF3048 domain-containing protein [Cellulomonas sp. NTE-D12]|uniref:DUF3048 domain-containing protein n=1 Tax=Cellulomonas sp. NTE-D12 TaxID=2962632 RepID=UPI00308163B0|nr:hypothetical protein CELD12_27900 [Cellulomonas sp. NTE-D12]